MTDLFKLILDPGFALQGESNAGSGKPSPAATVNVLRRQMPKRPHLNNTDRFLFVWLYRWFPSVREVVAIVSRRPSFAGTVLGFGRIGAGDPATALADRRSR